MIYFHRSLFILAILFASYGCKDIQPSVDLNLKGGHKFSFQVLGYHAINRLRISNEKREVIVERKFIESGNFLDEDHDLLQFIGEHEELKPGAEEEFDVYLSILLNYDGDFAVATKPSAWRVRMNSKKIVRVTKLENW
jgi:hypothetical protein